MLNSQVECAWACLADTEAAEQKVNERRRVTGVGGVQGQDA